MDRDAPHAGLTAGPAAPPRPVPPRPRAPAGLLPRHGHTDQPGGEGSHQEHQSAGHQRTTRDAAQVSSSRRWARHGSAFRQPTSARHAGLERLVGREPLGLGVVRRARRVADPTAALLHPPPASPPPTEPPRGSERWSPGPAPPGGSGSSPVFRSVWHPEASRPPGCAAAGGLMVKRPARTGRKSPARGWANTRMRPSQGSRSETARGRRLWGARTALSMGRRTLLNWRDGSGSREEGIVPSMALDDERCCFCRRAARVGE